MRQKRIKTPKSEKSWKNLSSKFLPMKMIF